MACDADAPAALKRLTAMVALRRLTEMVLTELELTKMELIEVVPTERVVRASRPSNFRGPYSLCLAHLESQRDHSRRQDGGGEVR
jgi:hypothetical protein